MPSAAEAIAPAFSRMAFICFKPFDIKKWFIMGFCAFLSTCGEGGVQQVRSIADLSSEFFPEIERFIRANLQLAIAIGIALLLFYIALHLVLTYIRCRGSFMLLDNIIRNRGAVVEPWKRFKPHAWGYFKFQVALLAISILTFVIIAAIAAAIAIPDFTAGRPGGFAIAAIVVGLLLALSAAIFLGCVGIFANDFVLPIMLARDVTFGRAWEEARYVIVKRHLGALILYFLLGLVFLIASSILAFVVMILTCCVAALPYLSSVVLLPIFVFFRAYSLSFLEQFDPAYQLWQNGPPPQTGFPIEPDPLPPPPAPMV